MRLPLEDKFIYETYYYLHFSKKIDWLNPKSFNEHIFHRMLLDRKSIYTTVADKYAVREYVGSLGSEKYLIPLHAKFDESSDIRLSSLPKQYVLKLNHDSGSVSIMRNNNKIDLDKTLREFDRNKNINYYNKTREWHYNNIKPCYIVEQILLSKEGELPYSYKCYCIGGKVEFIHVVNAEGNKSIVYSSKWEVMPFMYNHVLQLEQQQKPSNLSEIIQLSEKLSSDFTFIRIDLYVVDNSLFFGEITVNPNYGIGKFNPSEFDALYGKKISQLKLAK